MADNVINGSCQIVQSHHDATVAVVDEAATNAAPTTTVTYPQIDHFGKTRQYWRDIILGVNDGLVSTFLLVAGVTGGGLKSQNILLTAIAGAVAGAISMCAGEYVATKSQNEVMRGELALERIHVHENFNAELEELDEKLLSLIGIATTEIQLRQEIRTYYGSNPNALFQLMKALEFGVLEAEERSPLRAGLTSSILFIAGALPSVLPFAFSSDDPTNGIIAAAGLTCIALLGVGAMKTWATRTNCASAAMENLIIASCGGGIAYGIGVLFQLVVTE
jgi:vacuolar iron transporter family protein